MHSLLSWIGYLDFLLLVPDRHHILLYRSTRTASCGGDEKTNISLEDYFGMQTGFSLDREHHVLALICQRHVTFLAFDNDRELDFFRISIEENTGKSRS